MPQRPEASCVAHVSTPAPSPHDLALATVALALFNHAIPIRDHTSHALYLADMCRFLAVETSQSRASTSFEQLKASIKSIRGKYETSTAEAVLNHPLEQLEAMPQVFNDIQATFQLVDSIPSVCWEDSTDPATMSVRENTNRIHYSSPLGVFLRRVHLGYKVLTFSQSCVSRQDVLAWCAGDPQPETQDHYMTDQVHPGETDGTLTVNDVQGLGHGYSLIKNHRRVVTNSR